MTREIIKGIVAMLIILFGFYGIVWMHKKAFRPGSEAQKGFDSAIGIGNCK